MNAYTIDSDDSITVPTTSRAASQPGARVFVTAESLADLDGAANQRLPGVRNNLTGVRPSYPALFNKSPMQLRLIGARGGRAYGRNQRARRALASTQPQAPPQRAAPAQTTAEAVLALDAQFPWLRAAEKRHSGTSLHAGCKHPHHTA